MLPEQQALITTLLIKLGVVASLASFLARASGVKRMLLRENRTLPQRTRLALWFGAVFGAGVAVRIVQTGYKAVDLGLEGSLLAGMLGGYATGLLAGVIVSLPAMLAGGEFMTMPLLAGLGVLGGLIRDAASDPEDIWTFSPFPDLNLWRFIRDKGGRRRGTFHVALFGAIVFAEFLRQLLGGLFERPPRLFVLDPGDSTPLTLAVYATTIFAVALPLKVWNNTRNEMKLEEQQRSLMQARLDALTRQINPHFLFNTLNSVSSLIRTDPAQARGVIYKLSNILRRLLRRHENFTPVRDEISFLDDYLSIEVVRFGEKLRIEKNVEDDTLDLPIPTMILQPIIENSIKHGLSPKVEGGSIRISTKREGARLLVSVEDDGVGIPETRIDGVLGHGIGMSNVRERLQVLFGGDASLHIDSRAGTGTRVEIEIPAVETFHSKLAAVS